MRERCFAAHPLGVVADRDEKGGTGQWTEALDRDQLRGGVGDEAGEVLVEVADLLAELLVAARQASQRVLDDGQVAVGLASRPPVRGGPDQLGEGKHAQLLPEIGGCGDEQGSELVGGL